MTSIHIRPARRFHGEARVPGDKSIGHRVALIGAISEGTTEARNFPGGADCLSTLACLERLGVRIERHDGSLRLEGRGLGGLRPPAAGLDAGNSGTTVRLLAGILAGHAFPVTIAGDESLSRRPMTRIVEPLERFGARIDTTDGHLPIRIQGGELQAIDYRLAVPSAQVKSAVLLAGLHARGTTSVEEPIPTRDHTEIALAASGAAVRRLSERIEVDGGRPLGARSVQIPGDLSSAAFLIAAALVVPNSDLRLTGVGVNPSRTGCISILRESGGSIALDSVRDEGGEPVADIHVRASSIGPIEVEPAAVPSLIDELPILAVLGTGSGAGVRIRGARELRVKESDRIRALATNLRATGVQVEEFEDGLEVRANAMIEGGTVSSFGDHRIAMAFAVAALVSRSGITIEDAGCVDISFPGFFKLLDRLVER